MTRTGWLFALANTGFITRPERNAKRSSSAVYSSKFLIGRVATPDSIAAFATAGAMRRISRGSNGLGISEPVPKPCVSPLSNPWATASDGGSRASCAIAPTAACFISSLIPVAPTSSAPEDEWETQDIVDLVREVGAAGADHRI